MPSISARPVIRVGPAGWSYPDWRGVVYPRRTPQDFHELEYLAEFFPAVEINTTFYHPPRPPVVKEWVRQVEGKEFQFTAKLWQRFTHERRAGRRTSASSRRLLLRWSSKVAWVRFCFNFPGRSRMIPRIASTSPAFASGSENTLWSSKSGIAHGTSRKF